MNETDIIRDNLQTLKLRKIEMRNTYLIKIVYVKLVSPKEMRNRLHFFKKYQLISAWRLEDFMILREKLYISKHRLKSSHSLI